jgi:hypothetical protein
MAIVLDGTTGIVVSGNTNSFSGVYVGEGAGAIATNTAIGVSSLAANTTGSTNTALGASALAVNTSGSSNTAVGRDSLQGNSTGASHTAIGTSALYSNTSGTGNTSVGVTSLYTNTTGSFNVAVGVQTLRFSVAASNMVAVGYQSLYNNTTGTNNTAVGYQAGYTNQSGSTSTYLGVSAGYLSTGNYNTFVGSQAGYNTTGSGNTFIGVGPTLNGAGWAVTTGSNNTIIGGYTGNNGSLDIRTSSNNIVLSDGDGNPRGYCDSGSTWIFRGNTSFSKEFTAGGGSEYVTINAENAAGANAHLVLSCPGSNSGQVYFERSTSRLYIYAQSGGVYLAPTATAWTANSDERKKDIIEPIADAANKVSTLRAVIGKYKTDKDDVRRSFLIAQDVLAVFPEAVDSSNPDDLGVQYSDVIPLLVAAIKEQQAIITQLQADVAALKA